MADEIIRDGEPADELDEYAPEIVDLDGEPFEIIDSIDYEGVTYLALVPYTEDDEMTEESEFIILKAEDNPEKNELTLSTIDDEAFLDKLGDMFLKHFEEIFGDDE